MLKKTRKLLDDPKKWTKGILARDKFGCGTDLNGVLATQWCLVGAIQKFIEESPKIQSYPRPFTDIENYVKPFLPKKYLGFMVAFNDNKKTTHKAVLRLLDKAIEG